MDDQTAEREKLLAEMRERAERLCSLAERAGVPADVIDGLEEIREMLASK